MKIFNAICFCVLMDHHRQGIEKAHPAYVAEKLEIFQQCDEYSALTLLDAPNQRRVLAWCEAWGVPVPGETQVSTASLNPKTNGETGL